MGALSKSGRKILVVDDNETIVISITKVLEKEGYKTDFAYDGMSAIKKALYNNYGLILLDITLPDIDGFQVCTELKKNPATRFIPIIFISTLDDDKIYNKGFDLGVMDYLKKPIPSAELIFRIRNYLRLAETENKLRQSELLFRSIVNDQTEFVVRYKPDGTLTFVNAAFSFYMRKNTHELLGKNFYNLLGIDHDNEMRSRVSGTGMPVQTDIIQVISPGGEAVWHQWIQRSILDRSTHKIVIQSIGRDITMIKQAEKELLKLSTAIQQSRIAIIVTDTEGNTEYVNPFFEELTGFTHDELKGENSLLFLQEQPDVKLTKKIQAAISSGNIWQGEIVNRRKNNEVYILHAIITPIKDEKNRIVNYIGIGQDITRQKEIDRKILQTIISTEEKERSRFAQDLHDDLGPLLSTAKLYIRSFETASEAKNREIAVTMSMKAIDEAIMSIKEIANNISPHVLRNFGLVSGIQSFISKINETNTVGITFNAETDVRFDENTESSIFRIVSELINNTIKHANASLASVVFKLDNGSFLILYSDNGVGFSLEKALDKKMSRGINNILNRVKSLGGEISFAEKSKKGFSARVSIPVSGHIINN